MSNYQIMECEIKAKLAELKHRHEIDALNEKWSMDYARRLKEYEHEAEMLRIQREQFYKDNPDFPFKSMYMQVIAPPQKFEIIIL